VDRSEQIRSQKLLPAVIALDENQVITHWSHGAESLFGVSPEAAVGHSAERLDGWHLDPLTLQSYAQLPPGEVRSYHNQVVTRRGVHLTMNSLASSGLDAQGRKEVLVRFCLAPRPGRARADWLEPSAEDEPCGELPVDAEHHRHRPTARRLLARIRSHS
jgi:PAS domain S-box-containing protein